MNLYAVYMTIDTGADRYVVFRYVFAPNADVAQDLAIRAIDCQYKPEYNTVILEIIPVDMSTSRVLPTSRY